MASIDLDNASLQFRVRQSRRITFKEFLVRGLFRQSVNPWIEVRALEDLDLHLRDGDRLGVIGHNGAGKSTLLKLIAGIYPPTSGKREVTGRISSLFDIALGFEMEANGWENIAYRGYLQGETPRSLRSKVQQIAEFSELGDFLNMSVRYYSAGMMVRLAFAIATAIEPEILLIDEVLSAGDMAFQSKAHARMRALMAKARAIVLVSHDLNTIATMCDRVLWLDQGRMHRLGPVRETIAAYTDHMKALAAGAAA